MAADAVDAAQSVAGLPRRDSQTACLPLHGAPSTHGAASASDCYGTDRDQVDRLAGAGRRLVEGLTLTEAEVRYAFRAEFARTVDDVLARRHRALFLDATLAAAAAPAVASILAQERGVGADWCAAECTRFAALAARYRDLGMGV
ncbi:hypothetical protein GH664_01830 [Thauera sp. 2A1]|nr:hypothetical protein GH664_01830 [Thauera sp. 2A1]